MNQSTEENAETETYTYRGTPDEFVPLDVKNVVISSEAKFISERTFSGRASLVSVSFSNPISITRIEDYAFEHCTSLREFDIPECITNLGRGVFNACTSLQSIVIPKDIAFIPSNVFHDCESLKSVTILGPIRTIGNYAFFRCKSIESIKLPSSIVTICESAFAKCSDLQSIEIPASVKVIAASAFHKCSSLTTINIPDSVETIAWGTFAECKSLHTLKLPPSITLIGDYAFDGCTALGSIHIPNNVVKIGVSTFSGCTTLLSITIGKGVDTIRKDMFEGCISLMSVTIPRSVTVIEESAFRGCRSLTSVALHESIERICDHAFQGCISLSSIFIPEAIQEIGSQAFAECRQLEMVADDWASDVALWIRYRFNGRPAHRICYRSDVTEEMISSCLINQPASAKALDSLGMSALHILLMNDSAEPNMVKLLLLDNGDAVSAIAPLGRFPLHLACINPHVPLSVFEMLVNSFTKDGRLVLTVPDENKALPCALAIRCKRSDEIVMCLYERYPIFATNLRTKDEIQRLGRIRDQYIHNLSKQSVASIQAFDALQRDGWVSFVTGLDDGSDAAKCCIRFIDDADIHVVHILAYFKDLHGRQAIQSASNLIRHAFEQRILVFGRYELQRCPPISKTPKNCVLKVIDRRASDEYKNAFEMALAGESNTQQNRSIGEQGFKTFLNRLGVDASETVFQEALSQWRSNPIASMSEEQCVALCTELLDNGQPREVALKFMADTERFRREIDLRDRLRLDSEYVVFINNHFSLDTHNDAFLNALDVIKDEGGVEYADYKHALAMPLADSNLDTIFRNERPLPTEIRSLAQQLAEAVSYVHDKGIIHGSLTPRNVVRVGGRLRLIDFGAAVEFGSFVGATFSSGVLPPEMIAKLTVDECRRFDKYFRKLKMDDPIGWAKIDPKAVDESSYYAVKTFLSQEVPVSDDPVELDVDDTVTEYSRFEPIIDSNLPFTLLKAAASLDVWSFGVILFALHTGSSLFDANRDDDLASGEAMKELYEWNESKKLSKLKKVRDPLAHRLLRRILARDPSERYVSMDTMLVDDYFNEHWIPEMSDEMSCVTEDAIRKVTIELRNPKTDIMESIGQSPSAMLTSLFDAIEVKSPVCFIILPYKCIECPKEGSGRSLTAATDYLEKAFGYIEFVLEKILRCLSFPDTFSFASEFVQSPLVTRNMYLYLVDESTGESVCVDGVYPLDIDVRSERVRTFLPLLAMGIQAVARKKNAVGVMNMFLPGVPKNQIPSSMWDKVEAFVHESNKSGFIHQSLTDDFTVTSDGRASEFRELIGYLTENDTFSTLSGMRRICDKLSEKGMWVTEENAQTIENGHDSTWKGTSEEVVDGCCCVS